MPSIYQLKPAFQNLLRPLVRGLANAGVTANQVTLFACALSVSVGAVIYAKINEPAWFLLLPLLLFVRMALNAVDGMLAREHGQKSALGAILNELTDVVADAAIYLPFGFLPGDLSLPLAAVIWLAALTEMTGVIAVQIGSSRRYDGPMGKSDRAFVFGALGLAIGLGYAPPLVWLDKLWWALILLLSLTILNRARGALKEIRA